MKNSEKCLECDSISTVVNDEGTVSQCLKCNNCFFRCKSCRDKFNTKECSDEGLCKECKNKNL